MTIDPRTQALNNPFLPGAGQVPLPVVATPPSSTGPTNSPTMNPLPGGTYQPVQPNDPPSAANGYIANANTLTTVQDELNTSLMAVLQDTAYQQPNSLSALRQASYRWRFFMTTEHDLVQGAKIDSVQALYNTLDSIPQVTIAESGVTVGFNITSVEMEQSCGPTFRSHSSNMSKFTIDIVEPLGSNLIEAIVNSSASLGVQNFTKMWYYLELTFHGYDEDGSIDESPLDDMNLDNGGRWVYPLTITNIDMTLDESGAKYSIAANPYSMIAFDTTTLGSIPDKLNVSGATIQDFMNDFCTKLQASYKTRYLAEIYKFKVVIDPIQDDGRTPATFKLTQTDTDSVRNLSLDTTGGRAPTANIVRGTTVNDVIIFLYAHCEEAQAMMLDTNVASALEDGTSGSGTGSSETATFNKKQYRIPIVPVIEPEVSVFGYDPVTGTYMKEITFHIRSYRNYTANLTASQYGNIKKDPRVAVAIVNDLKKRNYLRKCYEYRFTGLNTEVLKMDPATFNFSFQAILPRISGWAQDTPSVSQHEKYNPATGKQGGSLAGQTNETSATPGQLSASQLASANATATGSQLNNDNNNIDSVQDTLQQQFGGNNALTTNDPSTGKPYTAAQQAQYQSLQQQLAAANTDKASLASAAQAERDQSNQTAALRRQQIEAGGSTNTFAEDASTANSVFQMSYVQGNDESSQAIGKGFTGQWHRGASLVGALFNQLYQAETNSLQQVSLDIRGDPYWLGASNLERRAVMNGAPPQTNSVLPDWTAGDTTYALILKFPNGIDATTGKPIMRNDDVFNGMYRVTNVKSRFADGQFTQTLTSHKLEIITMIGTNTGSDSGDSGGTTPTSGTTPAA